MDFVKGLEISGLSLLGVFGALLVFYVVVLLLDKIPEKNASDET